MPLPMMVRSIAVPEIAALPPLDSTVPIAVPPVLMI